ncbi:MAG: heterocyst differentiation related protein [Sphaerospermopsis sp. SIO1G2]|nr:heterocyst differentiation related protein [Sphaerospermopsis sp. SIO1G1]NET71940.1 heterocyst differentiation related protein [Sphaerospermopsis sp. SIO1G2]
MSESMAFIGGVAVAGLAALLLLKGTNTPVQQPNFAVAPQMQVPVTAPQVMQPSMQYPPNYGQPVYSNSQPIAPNNNQSLQIQKQLDELKVDNQQLRLQNQQLQGQIQNLNTQKQWELAQTQNQPKLAALPAEEKTWLDSPILWAVGGATLTIGGGVVVAGVLSLFAPKQRPTRTVQVIHPYQGQTPPLANNVRRAEFLPSSRSDARRVENAEYDELR